ncbi:MAG: nitrogen fixation protein NifX [Methylococcaceae bacterium]|nr:MAG: nitrogen fixation protein NifX [Methylococcaceae bacterium]
MTTAAATSISVPGSPQAAIAGQTGGPAGLSREAALRVGLAARVLPDVSPRQLLELLIDKLGAPLTEEKLAHVTVTQLKTGLGSPDGEEDTEHLASIAIPHYKEAVRILWGEADDSGLPTPVPYSEGDLPGSVRVAVAANSSGERVDGHFGSCLRFLVYQVAKDQARLIAVRSALDADETDDRNAARAELIKDCQVLYVVSIGGPAAAKVIRAGIYPIKLPEEADAAEVIAKFQAMLQGNPPPWLAKAMGITRQRLPFDSDEPLED